MSDPVRESDELRRIRALPRRVWAPGQAEALAEQWSPLLLNERGRAEWERLARLPPRDREAELTRFAKPKLEGGHGSPLRLKPVQAIALYEAIACRGLFLAAPVGAGKSAVSFLLARVLNARRPLLIVPASIIDQTHVDFENFAQFWIAPNPLPQIETYESFTRKHHAWKFCDCPKCTGLPNDPGGGLRPDLVIPDEADKLRRREAVVRKRFARYAARHPEVMSCPMTGTIFRKSIRDIQPLLIWALKLGAPVPFNFNDLEEWCEATDDKPHEARRSPGALLTLAPPIDCESELEAGRRAFQQRLTETPGVVIFDEQSCDEPLLIRVLKAPDDPILDQAFEHFRSTETTLDGWDLGDPLSVLRHATELSAGFYYKWSPRPPADWIKARQDWFRFVRQSIKDSQHSRSPMDSAEQVALRHRDHPFHVAWKKIEKTFVPNTVAVPITASVLGYAAQWTRENTPALVWVQHEYVGLALSKMLGIPFFQGGGKTAAGQSVRNYDPRGSAIMSIQGNYRGRNLQSWHTNLVIGPVHAAPWWEQGYLGRTHRGGQTHPVSVGVLISCGENLTALEAAHREAHTVQQTLGHTQKILIAEFDWSQFPAAELDDLPLDHPSRPRWVRRTQVPSQAAA